MPEAVVKNAPKVKMLFNLIWWCAGNFVQKLKEPIEWTDESLSVINLGFRMVMENKKGSKESRL